MTIHLGNVAASTVLYIPFHTFDSNGASITLTGLAVTDIEIYKDGSVTQRSSDAGYTLLDTDGIDFDGLTGIHGFSVNLADNTDAGFYAAGSFYWVVVSAVTVDTRTVSFVAATFMIGPVAANMTQILGTAVSSPATAGVLDVNVKNIDNDAASASGTVTFPNATLASTTNITAGVMTTTTNLTTNNDKTGYGLSSAAVQAVWDALTSALTTVGSIGKLIVDNLNATISSRASQTSVDDIPTNAELATALGTADDAVLTAIDALPTAAENADAVWDEDATAHQTTGTFGQAIGDPVADTNTIYKAVVSDATGATVGVDVVAVKAETVLILEDTGTTLQGELDGIQTDTEDIQTRIPAALTANGNMKSSLMEIIATALTETSGLIAAAFKQFFNVATPTGTMKSISNVVLVDTVTTYTGNTLQTGDSYARLGAPAGASVSADVAALKTEAEAMIIKKNTALANFEFLMVASSDHITPKTGLTITATRSIDGAAFASCTNSASEVSSGIYKISLAAADLNGDVITFKFTGTDADQTTITVLTQA